MDNEKILRRKLFKVVKDQIQLNKPPETAITLNRLKQQGYSETEAMMLISKCIEVDIFDLYQHGKKYIKNRYISNLQRLPDEPIED